MADIFISYKSERRPAVSFLARTLENYGFTVWFDYGLLSGADFGRQIERELRAARAVLVLWCPLSVDSEWVLEEATLAKRLGSLIPVKLSPVELPMGFQRADTINISAWDGAPRSHQLDKLIEQLSARVGHDPAPRFNALVQQERDWRIAGPKPLADFPLDAKAGAEENRLRAGAGEAAAERVATSEYERADAKQKAKKTDITLQAGSTVIVPMPDRVHGAVRRFVQTLASAWRFGLGALAGVAALLAFLIYIGSNSGGTGKTEEVPAGSGQVPISATALSKKNTSKDVPARPIVTPASLPNPGSEPGPIVPSATPATTTASDTPPLPPAKQPARVLVLLRGHKGEVSTANFSPDGRRIVTASSNTRIWDAKSGALLTTLTGHSGWVYGAAFSPDGRRIVTASYDKTARIWEAASGALLTKLTGHQDGLYDAAFSPDGRRIVTASADETARIWDAKSGALLTTLTGHGGWVYGAAFSPDGRHIVTASYDKTARIWDATSGALLTTLTGHGESVEGAAFSPDGRRIVTASADKTARIWDARSGALLTTLTGHGSWFSSAAFSSDGRRIVTASADKTARVWDAKSGALLTTLTGHGDWVRSAAFSPDGRRIVTASDDKTARIWSVSVL